VRPWPPRDAGHATTAGLLQPRSLRPTPCNLRRSFGRRRRRRRQRARPAPCVAPGRIGRRQRRPRHGPRRCAFAELAGQHRPARSCAAIWSPPQVHTAGVHRLPKLPMRPAHAAPWPARASGGAGRDAPRARSRAQVDRPRPHWAAAARLPRSRAARRGRTRAARAARARPETPAQVSPACDAAGRPRPWRGCCLSRTRPGRGGAPVRRRARHHARRLRDRRGPGPGEVEQGTARPRSRASGAGRVGGAGAGADGGAGAGAARAGPAPAAPR